MPRNKKTPPAAPPNLPDLMKLSREELLALYAQELLNQRQSVPVARDSARARLEVPKVDWTKTKKTCPKCGHEGPVDPDFGVKTVRGIERSQSWCKSCRASTNYYDTARKYKR